jgi:hypothetical protein
MEAYKCIGPEPRFVNGFTGTFAREDEDAAVVQTSERSMILTRRQQIATIFLAVLIVASVISMPRSFGESRESRPAPRSAGVIAAAPAVTKELSHEQVRDLTYN